MPLSQNEISQQIYRKNYSALSTEEKSSVDKVVQNDRALEALQYAQNNRLSTEQFADHARSQGMSGLGGDGAGRTGALQQRQQNIWWQQRSHAGGEQLPTGRMWAKAKQEAKWSKEQKDTEKREESVKQQQAKAQRVKEIARKTAVQQAKKAAEKKAAMRLLITTSEIWIPIVLAAVGITSIFSLLLFMI